MFAFPYTPKRPHYTSTRFFEREFGVEYTKYELNRKQEIYNAKIKKLPEISGYVAWSNKRKAFLIVPTLTSFEPYIFCEIPDEIDLPIPPERSFIVAKGKLIDKGVIRNGNLIASTFFMVSHYKLTKPDIEVIKPDIRYHDFKGILFDALTSVDEPIKDVIAHSLASSPGNYDRLGGLTLSVYNESKGTSKLLLSHIRRFLPKEFLHARKYSLAVEEIGRSIRLDPFPWLYKSFDADAELSNDALTLMKRSVINTPSDEIMISLHSENDKPKTLRDPPAVMADMPIVAGNSLERKNGFYDTSPEILKFIIAAHLVPLSLSFAAYNSNIDYLQERLTKITSKYPEFKSELGRGGILDLDIHGKPSSLFHLALSDGRSNIEVEMTRKTIDNALKIFELNMDNTLAIWQKAFPGAKHDLSWASPEQREIYGYIYEHGPSTHMQVYEALKNQMSYDSFKKWWEDLHNNRGGIYEKKPGIYDIAPFSRDS